MNKKFTLVLMLFLISIGMTIAQRTISGTITDDTGEALIGASILVEGTNTGTVTDIDGKYELKVPDGGKILVISYTGFSEQKIELGESAMLDVTMSEGIELKTVFVDALGVTRDEKTVGYSVQSVSGDDLSLVQENNVVGALSGKIAGVQVVSASGASLGGSSNIKIRGANGLNGGSPLFVVDGTPISNEVLDDKVGGSSSGRHRGTDYGNLAQDINPNDIASVSVLKGPAATALYGQRGANGVIMITTKKGENRKGIGVDVNSGVTFDRVYVMPQYQNEYAGGYTQEWSQFEYNPDIHDPKYAEFDGQNILNYAADESWGPKMDGTMYRPWWSWYPNAEGFGEQIALTSNEDNVRNFFDTGMTYNNSVALTGGNEKTLFRVSYTNLHQTGIIPNSRLVRNTVGISASNDFTDKFNLAANVSFVNNEGRARPTYGYLGNNPVLSFNQWFQRQLDIDRLRDYKNPDGSFRSWNIRSPTNLRPLYWDSPFFSPYENFSTDGRTRYFGNVTATYSFTENLSLQGSVRRDNYTQRVENRVASGGLDLPSYSELTESAQEDNYDFLISYDKRFGDNITLDVNGGGAIRKNTRRFNYFLTEGGLNSVNYFNVAASTDRPTLESGLFEKEVRSLYTSANVGFRDFVYLGFSLRNDWSSALPADNNSYLYPSVSASLVFSELIDANFLSYGKLRASFAQVGSDIGEYNTSAVFEPEDAYGSTSAFTVPDVLANANIQPALTSSYEVGLDLRFLKNRLGLDVTYYNQDAKNQILQLSVSGASGTDEAFVNAGLIRSNGIEIALSATPVKTSKFSWDMSVNFAKNQSKVIELAEGLDNYELDFWARGWGGGLSINAPVGGEWGMLRGQGYKIHEGTGLPIISEDGSYIIEQNKDLGSVLPDFNGGIRNTFSFAGITLGAFLDFQMGGKFHSITRMFNAYSGLALETVGNNDKGVPVRDAVADGGGIKVEGVLEDGTAHAAYVDPASHFPGMFGLHERWVYDASYLKLRELSLGYNIPKRLYEKTRIQNVNLSLVARNVWLISSQIDGIDPSEVTPSTNGLVFVETGILPSVRSIGFNLKLGF